MLACVPSSITATQTTFATTWASKTWCASLVLFRLLFSAFALTFLPHAQITTLNASTSPLFAKQEFANYTVNGQIAGLYKNAGTFSYLRIFGSGHEVPAYLWRGIKRGATALQMFTQIMSDKPLSGT